MDTQPQYLYHLLHAFVQRQITSGITKAFYQTASTSYQIYSIYLSYFSRSYNVKCIVFSVKQFTSLVQKNSLY